MCSMCKESGFVVATSKKTRAAYAFRCSCYRSTRLAKIIPEWSDRKHRAEFDVEFISMFTSAPDFKSQASDPEKSKKFSPPETPDFDLDEIPW